jgi:hypothetical protein
LVSLEPLAGAPPRSSFITFNLASTRVFAIPAAGTRTYYFKLARITMDPVTFCYVYNAAFSVVFVP